MHKVRWPAATAGAGLGWWLAWDVGWGGGGRVHVGRGQC